MKFILKMGKNGLSKEDFWYQHRIIDSFTGIRASELTENPDSQEATQAYEEMKIRLLFTIACFNTDNGSENEKEFSQKLQQENIFHFYSIQCWQAY